MKKFLSSIAIISILAVAAFAFAHGHDSMGDRGRMMGQGCSGHMGGPMMGVCGQMSDQKFLDETRDLRKQLHEKKFEYFETVRNPQTSPEALAGLEKDMDTLQDKISEKAPHPAFSGCGRCKCW